MQLTHELIKNNLPVRFSHQNKGDFGHVLVIGGSYGMAGAVCMTAQSALKSGAGLVTVAVPEKIADIVSVKLTECMVLPLPDENGMLSASARQTIKSFLPKVNTVVFGMGARKCAGTAAILEFLLQTFTGTLVLDADALNVLAENPELFHIKRKCMLILTPHPGEMARLMNREISFVQAERENNAKKYAQTNNLVLVLKGEGTVISDGEKLCLNPTGNVGMATGGSGDVLAGVIGGLVAQKIPPLHAAFCGCYLHGLAGDIALKEKTYFSLTACDLITYLPEAFREILL